MMDWLWLLLAIATLATIALRLRDYITGETMLLDRWDAWQVRKADLATLDRAGAARTDRSEVVVSLSTIPSRLPHIEATLKSLLRQKRLPREIRINVPAFSRREKCAYEIPDWLKTLKMVRVAHCADDFGPATKFIPTLLEEEPDRMVLVVDDDRIYPPTLLEDLERAARAKPDAAYTACGWIVPKDMTDRPTNFSNIFPKPPAPMVGIKLFRQRPVDIVKGVAGYLVRPRFFDLTRLPDYSGVPDEAFYVDDIWLSGLCGVPKYVVPTRRMDFHPAELAVFYRSTSLGEMDRDKQRNTVMLRYFGADCWRVGGPNNL